jgi:PTH2 family peptidyl-tRNA hydrolase
MANNYNVKQVIILRKDLNMRKGKMVAQGAHASMAVLLNRGEVTGYSEDRFEFPMNDDITEWVTGSFAKICVSCNSEEELHNLYRQATKAGLPASIIKDAGFTEFNGVPTYTAVAIGPAKASEIDLITGDLKLL